MSVWIKAVACAALAAASGLASAQTVYKWKDANGKWAFGDRPPASAPAQAVALDKGPKPSASNSEQSLQNAKAARLFPVILYANKCGEGCDLAVALLTERGAPFVLKDPSLAENFEAFKKASPEALAPAMTVGDKALSPFNDLAWIAALDEAGYAPAPKKAAQPRPAATPSVASAAAPAGATAQASAPSAGADSAKAPAGK